MFQSDAKLFLSANNNINSAKTIINECIRLLTEVELPESSDYSTCKSSLENSGINALIDKAEETKESLMKLDQEFASEYMTLLQEFLQTSTIDTSNMSEEERMQYSIQMSNAYKDYNYNLLYMLEQYEESGMLTPELETQLDMQRLIIEQYELQDQMSSLAVSSDEYIELFKQNAELDKKLINLNPNLTEEEKKSSLQEYEANFNSTLDVLELQRDINVKSDELKDIDAGTEKYYKKEIEIYQLQIDYYNNKGNLTEEEKAKLEELKNYKELNSLYIKQLEVNDNWIPFDGYSYDDEVFTLKKEMGIATENELEYLEMGFWERQLHYTGTFVCATFEGAYSVVEGIIDGTVMLAGAAGSLFGADTKWAEDFVKIDMAGDMYAGLTNRIGINQNIAYGSAHDSGFFVGELAATVALTFVGGGAGAAAKGAAAVAKTVAVTAVHGLKGMGEASEEALLKDCSFWKSFGYGAANGAVDAACAYMSYGTAGPASSLKNTLQGNLWKKCLFNASKEFIKEGNSCWIDGEYDLEKAIKNAGKAAVVVLANALVSKLVGEDRSEKKIKAAEKEEAKIKGKIAQRESELETIKSKEGVDEALKGVKEKYKDFSGGISQVERLEKSLEHWNNKLAHVWDDVNIIDRLNKLGWISEVINKAGAEDFAKDGYEVIADSIYDGEE